MLYFNLLTLTFIYFSAANDFQPELEIRPRGTEFIRPLDSNIVFTCNVANIGAQLVPIQLRWYNKHGAEIVDPAAEGRRIYVEYDGPSTKKLYIHVAPEHEGTYTCNGVVEGNQQTKAVQLTLYKDITYDAAPTPQNPTQYSEGLIECRVSGQPIPIVSWRYRGNRIQTGGRYTQDHYGLRIQNITTADNGLYYCRAEVDADGRYEEKAIEVTVYIRPTMVSGVPRKFEGEQAQQFSLPCRARGFPDPKYIFYKDDNENPLYSTDRVEVDGDAGNVHFRPLHKEDGGRYRCVAFNDVGQIEDQLELKVKVPPTIYNLKNVTQAEGQSVTIVCLSWGDPAPTMSFRKAGNPLEYQMGENEGGRIVMSNPLDGELRLTINNLVPEDMSNYTCKSVNIAGFHVINGTVTVQFRPRFPANHPTEVYTWAGKTRNMTCHVLAEPLPVIEWLHNGRALVNNETYRIYVMSKDTNLQVTIREADQGWVYGEYICRARNQYGTGEQKMQLRRANVPDAPRNVSVRYRSTTIISLFADPPSEDGGVPIYAFRVDYDQGKVLEFEIGDEIYVENLHGSTTYVFQIRARNEVGVGLPAQIMVRTDDIRVPSTLILTSDVFSPSAYEYIVSWKKPETGGMAITEYDFKLRKLRGAPDTSGPEPISEWITRRRPESVDNPSRYYSLQDLQPFTWYQLEVRAYNSIGWSQANELFYFRTAPGDMPYPPDPNDPGKITDSDSSSSVHLSTFVGTLLSVVFSIVYGRT